MCHVLIIEDEPIIALGLEQMLGDAGATSFDWAATEEEAVACARGHLPELITSDVKLLEGTGPQAITRIMAEHGRLPVIFVTGTPEACDACDHPAVVLTKPVTSRALVNAFRTLDPLGLA